VTRRVLLAAALLLVFAAGIGVGEAIHDNPTPGGTQTLVRTLQPLPLAPAAVETVTTTVTQQGR
jgi:hypothetical protein